MRLAEARLAASTMISCSMMASLTDMSSVAAWLWMMNTSVPRTDSPKRQWSSPLANSARFGVAERDAEALGDLLGERQVGPTRHEVQPLLGDQLHLVASTLLRPAGSGVVAWSLQCRTARCGRRTATCVPGSSTANGPTWRSSPISASRPDGLLDHGARAHDAVDQPGVGADLGAGADDAAPLQHRAGEEGDVGGELDGGVDVGALGVEHRDALAQPRRRWCGGAARPRRRPAAPGR